MVLHAFAYDLRIELFFVPYAEREVRRKSRIFASLGLPFYQHSSLVIRFGDTLPKASAVARAVGRDGHNVFTAEISPYEFCHTRFCRFQGCLGKLFKPGLSCLLACQDMGLGFCCVSSFSSKMLSHGGPRWVWALGANLCVEAFCS